MHTPETTLPRLIMRFSTALLCAAMLLAPHARGQTPPHEVPAQRELIEAAVSQMAPSEKGQASVYYVGFAAFGEQTVFRKEEELAISVFGTRFGSALRSLELVNDVHDRRTHPLATYLNLRYALNAIAKRMDLDRDVLVLMLTSHGNADGIAVTNGNLFREVLAPSDLEGLLDEAKIRWRVIVVSACYSGVFIPPLESDTSVVITAADSNHSSFGCADNRDLTWFGEALLQDALPDACSLSFAFEDTSYLIRRREGEQGLVHSNPQISLGTQMKDKLDEIDITGRKCKPGGSAAAPGP
jgi:hypothetical protein